MDTISKSQNENESRIFPRWLAQSLSQNLNLKHEYFLRENREQIAWISWGKAAENSCKSLLTYMTQFKYKKVATDPHWKFRAIYSANLINKMVRNFSGKGRVELVVNFLNHFSQKEELYDPITPVQLRMVYLEVNRLNCHVRDLEILDERARPKNWVAAARRNYLRMLRSDFEAPERQFTDWELCFRNNRVRLGRFEQEFLFIVAEKNKKHLEQFIY
ncbi:hypothetical protein [Leptospira weilii]|uniref:hypothetical protein n=1 Tax=Leptospira weilii TaxID=28184 RepID=UPI0003135EF2|nr:hypothetical protein [Leptospira weilii]OMI14757.1 hypothetical protein BUQ74_20415 [Leptospira weilii serovar Heyan]ULH27428.1 hypothetical protein FH586_13495 [Leptospira weilii]UPY77585.1 hypothetical protein FH581_001615 [Leptospira weilii]